MGRLHTAALRRVRDHFPECEAIPRLVVAADDVAANADAAVDVLGYERATTDPFAVLRDPEVDAVSITTPNHMHLPLCVAAAEAGKAFWGEKPLGRSPAETAEIAAAVQRHQTTSVVGFNYRHVPAIAKAKELVDAGAIGEVRTFHGRFLVDYASDEDRTLSWRFLRELAGLGVLGDLMSHVVDLAHLLVGRLDAVTAFKETDIDRRPQAPEGTGTQFSRTSGGATLAVENEDYAASFGRFDAGGRAVMEVSRTMVGRPCDLGIALHGTHGAIAWDFQRMGELRLHRGGSGADRGYTTVLAGPGFGTFGRFQPDAGIAMGYDDLKVVEAYLLLQSTLDGVRRSPHVLDALAVAEVLDAMERSCASGAWEAIQPIDVSPATAAVGLDA
jgi:predicted dehydrogenase